MGFHGLNDPKRWLCLNTSVLNKMPRDCTASSSDLEDPCDVQSLLVVQGSHIYNKTFRTHFMQWQENPGNVMQLLTMVLLFLIVLLRRSKPTEKDLEEVLLRLMLSPAPNNFRSSVEDLVDRHGSRTQNILKTSLSPQPQPRERSASIPQPQPPSRGSRGLPKDLSSTGSLDLESLTRPHAPRPLQD